MAEQMAYIGLGSNLGEREKLVKNALRMLTRIAGAEVTRTSKLIETLPLGRMEQPPYLNAVAEIKTRLSPLELFGRLVEIEDLLGRERRQKWDSRTIDLDLLLYNDEVVRTERLTIPHPQMHLRSFVLTPLAEIAPQLAHPVLNETIGALNARLNGASYILKPEKPQLISVAGNIGVGKTTLAKNLAEVLSCRLLLEAYDTNPYLAEVYAGRAELALDSQLYFLTSRAEQLDPSRLEPGRAVVADYIFEKELIYAQELPEQSQKDLYARLYGPVSAAVAAPVIAVYMYDTPERCLQRIQRRNRPYEQGIDLTFLQRLDERYEGLFRRFRNCPLFRMDASVFDCTDEAAVTHLAEQMGHYMAVPSEG
jgi:2-amino-4-hydroxy-6-hydroxymethyldihydropteridine diphosphokinase